MVNMLTQQIGTMFNPLIQHTNQNYEMLAPQIGRITYFFGIPHVRNPLNLKKIKTPTMKLILIHHSRQN